MNTPITLRLWRALRKPARQHPLFHRVLEQDGVATPAPTSTFFMWVFLLTSIGFCWMVIFDWIPLLILLALIFANTASSINWSVNISRTIVDEKAQNRFDLLAAMPVGAPGVTWAMCTGYLHRQASFRWIPFIVKAMSLVLLLTFIGAVFVSVLILGDTTMPEMAFIANTGVLATAIAGLFFVVVFYLDHLYTVIIAALTGMIAPVDVLSSAEARLRAVSGFLMIQVLTYLVCWLIVITLPAIARTEITVPGVLMQCVMGIAFFIALRELTVRFLWQRLIIQLNAGHNDLDLLLAVQQD